MTPEQKKLIGVPLRLTLKELTALPEYSMSLPTGTTIGKRWRGHPVRTSCACNFTGRADPSCERWSVGEYCTSEHPDTVDILWRPVVIVTEQEKARDAKFLAPSRPVLSMECD